MLKIQAAEEQLESVNKVGAKTRNLLLITAIAVFSALLFGIGWSSENNHECLARSGALLVAIGVSLAYFEMRELALDQYNDWKNITTRIFDSHNSVDLDTLSKTEQDLHFIKSAQIFSDQSEIGKQVMNSSISANKLRTIEFFLVIFGTLLWGFATVTDPVDPSTVEQNYITLVSNHITEFINSVSLSQSQ